MINPAAQISERHPPQRRSKVDLAAMTSESDDPGSLATEPVSRWVTVNNQPAAVTLMAVNYRALGLQFYFRFLRINV